jgi:hypothetical protein
VFCHCLTRYTAIQCHCLARGIKVDHHEPLYHCLYHSNGYISAPEFHCGKRALLPPFLPSKYEIHSQAL